MLHALIEQGTKLWNAGKKAPEFLAFHQMNKRLLSYYGAAYRRKGMRGVGAYLQRAWRQNTSKQHAKEQSYGTVTK